MADEDIVRVLRLIEYIGPRALVEKQVTNSIHGSRVGMAGQGKGVLITAVTLNESRAMAAALAEAKKEHAEKLSIARHAFADWNDVIRRREQMERQLMQLQEKIERKIGELEDWQGAKLQGGTNA